MPDTDPAAMLAAIREREQKATRGPWSVVRDQYDDEPWPTFPAGLRLPEPQRWRLPDGSLSEVRDYSYEYSDFSELTPETVEWIAAARSDVPRLLDFAERTLALAGRWAQHSTGYDARAECADELRRLAREVLGQDGGA